MLQSSHDESSITSTTGDKFIQDSEEDLSEGSAEDPPDHEGDDMCQAQDEEDHDTVPTQRVSTTDTAVAGKDETTAAVP